MDRGRRAWVLRNSSGSGSPGRQTRSAVKGVTLLSSTSQKETALFRSILDTVTNRSSTSAPHQMHRPRHRARWIATLGFLAPLRCSSKRYALLPGTVGAIRSEQLEEILGDPSGVRVLPCPSHETCRRRGRPSVPNVRHQAQECEGPFWWVAGAPRSPKSRDGRTGRKSSFATPKASRTTRDSWSEFSREDRRLTRGGLSNRWGQFRGRASRNPPRGRARRSNRAW